MKVRWRFLGAAAGAKVKIEPGVTIVLPDPAMVPKPVHVEVPEMLTSPEPLNSKFVAVRVPSVVVLLNVNVAPLGTNRLPAVNAPLKVLIAPANVTAPETLNTPSLTFVPTLLKITFPAPVISEA